MPVSFAQTMAVTSGSCNGRHSPSRQVDHAQRLVLVLMPIQRLKVSFANT